MVLSRVLSKVPTNCLIIPSSIGKRCDWPICLKLCKLTAFIQRMITIARAFCLVTVKFIFQ